jgi:hypothetical protein
MRQYYLFTGIINREGKGYVSTCKETRPGFFEAELNKKYHEI